MVGPEAGSGDANCLPLWFQLPEHIHDYPSPAPLRHLEIVDPIGCVDADGRGVAIDVEDAHLVEAIRFRRLLASAIASVLDESHRTLGIEPIAAEAVAADDSLRQLGVECTLHTSTVAGVPALDVVERRLADRC